jgi:predicted transcriptional regulator
MRKYTKQNKKRGKKMQLTIENYFNQSVKLNRREKEVYDVLLRSGASTSHDLLNKLGHTNPNYVRPRLTDLRKKGMIDVFDKVKVNGILQYRWAVII